MDIRPTLRLQSIGFCIGSLCFVAGAFPPYATLVGSTWTNATYFIGSWFFTGAAFIQLVLSGPQLVPHGQDHKFTPQGSRGMALSAAWLAAATQFIGTILFNFSTGDALIAHSVRAQQYDVWGPNATGSAAFLISGWFIMVTLLHSNQLWKVLYKTSLSGWINFAGCVAFGVSAWAAFVFRDGHLKNTYLANMGTFIGGWCFFFASIFFVGRKYGRQGDDAPSDAEPKPATA